MSVWSCSPETHCNLVYAITKKEIITQYNHASCFKIIVIPKNTANVCSHVHTSVCCVPQCVEGQTACYQ